MHRQLYVVSVNFLPHDVISTFHNPHLFIRMHHPQFDNYVISLSLAYRSSELYNSYLYKDEFYKLASNSYSFIARRETHKSFLNSFIPIKVFKAIWEEDPHLLAEEVQYYTSHHRSVLKRVKELGLAPNNITSNFLTRNSRLKPLKR